MKRNGKYAIMSDEAYAEMLRQRGEHLKELYRKERRRVLFGIDQKTRLRVVRAPREKTNLRHRLRKRGYVVGKMSNDVLVTAETMRSIKSEEHARRLGMKVLLNS